MAYFEIGKDWDGDESSDGFGAGVAPQAPSSRSRIVRYAFDNRGVEAMPKVVVPQKTMISLHIARLQKLKAMLPAMRATMLPQASLRGFGGAEGLSPDADAIIAAIDGLRELQTRTGSDVATAVGAGSIVSRAGTLAGDLGLPINQTDFIETAKREAKRFTGLVGGEGKWTDIVAAFTGMRATAAMRDAGASLGEVGALATKFGDVYKDLSSGLSTASDSVYNAIRDEMGFADQGLRRLIDSMEQSGAGNFLNERTMGLALGVAQRWASVATGDDKASAQNILGAAGATAGAIGSIMIGAAAVSGVAASVPVVGWVVAIAGAIISITAALLNAFEAEPPPPPGPCTESPPDGKGAPRHQDEWACLRLFIASDPDLGVPDTASVDDLQGGWAVKLDPNTGEVLVSSPGNAAYRRLLDVFPNGRRNLLTLEPDWIAGQSRVSLAILGLPECHGGVAEEPERYGVGAWATGCLYEWRPYSTYGFAGTRIIKDSVPYLWCVNDKNDSVVRFVNADRTSPSIRFRVPPLPSDLTKANAGYRGSIGWDEGLNGVGHDWIMKKVDFQYQRKAGILAAAILGGCAPFGFIKLKDTWAVCTGVGGRVHRDGEDRGFWTPAIAAWKNNQVLVLPPVRFDLDTTLRGARDAMYSVEIAVSGMPLRAVVDELEDEHARIFKWHAPAASPPYTPAASRRIMLYRPEMMPVGKIFKTGLTPTGLSTGAKWGIGLGAAALAAGGGYWAWRKWGRNR